MELTILHAGKGYVVIDKPAGIAVERNFNNDTVEARALVQWRRPGSTKPPYVGIVHRLDRPVSGCLIVAKNISTLRLLNKAFEEKKVDKTYLARTATPLPAEKGSLKHYLARDHKGRKAVASKRPVAGAKESLLHYKLVGRVEEDYLYEITPITGRFHQIRVQLATAGAPIIGDVTYGSERIYLPECICLRAVRLGFADPHTGERTEVSAPAIDWATTPK
ncbi:RluA family pseudouridine synthase [Neolewinella aurantiaca]|uniref:RluA family pseudouridine synthase n=1 Tax=Neolewinella aurantiaca TaxID=2602767 RepID=A0A5C7FK81_9BACT|nr:RluA family pseudouridine synthase [Neolewinella aurantiaca]TXF91083.1 RluA family pseudouridine synthase [Neolewinella aurantiaca]